MPLSKRAKNMLKSRAWVALLLEGDLNPEQEEYVLQELVKALKQGVDSSA